MLNMKLQSICNIFERITHVFNGEKLSQLSYSARQIRVFIFL